MSQAAPLEKKVPVMTVPTMPRPDGGPPIHNLERLALKIQPSAVAPVPPPIPTASEKLGSIVGHLRTNHCLTLEVAGFPRAIFPLAKHLS